eukprot:1585253-Pyramimonas_sp.AAC.2
MAGAEGATFASTGCAEETGCTDTPHWAAHTSHVRHETVEMRLPQSCGHGNCPPSHVEHCVFALWAVRLSQKGVLQTPWREGSNRQRWPLVIHARRFCPLMTACT